mmetsp:Transcript_6826/g.20148  ORF Transcript_6826/g.20148 Transcript_6826/m.20148 type:complete len:241 (-) Transcript_6826:176-898(-)
MMFGAMKLLSSPSRFPENLITRRRRKNRKVLRKRKNLPDLATSKTLSSALRRMRSIMSRNTRVASGRNHPDRYILAIFHSRRSNMAFTWRARKKLKMRSSAQKAEAMPFKYSSKVLSWSRKAIRGVLKASKVRTMRPIKSHVRTIRASGKTTNCARQPSVVFEGSPRERLFVSSRETGASSLRTKVEGACNDSSIVSALSLEGGLPTTSSAMSQAPESLSCPWGAGGAAPPASPPAFAGT